MKDERTKKFLMFYERLGNVRESALRAGFEESVAFEEGTKILTSLSSGKALRRLSSRTKRNAIRQGLERLAFGDINDVVSLVFAEEPLTPAEISHLDLFNVSELKRVKGGGVEVKLFDRQKALEALWEMQSSTDTSSSAQSFFEAIRNSADKRGEEGGEL